MSLFKSSLKKSFSTLNQLKSNKVLILDFGSQLTHLIARRIREIDTYCEIQPFDID